MRVNVHPPLSHFGLLLRACFSRGCNFLSLWHLAPAAHHTHLLPGGEELCATFLVPYQELFLPSTMFCFLSPACINNLLPAQGKPWEGLSPSIEELPDTFCQGCSELWPHQPPSEGSALPLGPCSHSAWLLLTPGSKAPGDGALHLGLFALGLHQR